MRFSSFALGLAGVSAAAAAAVPTILEMDDVVLYGEGKTQIVKRHEWQAMEEERLAHLNEKVRRRQVEFLPAHGPPTNYEGPAAPLTKRQCSDGEVDEVKVTNEEHFLQWDVRMSPVITARYDQATVSMTQGYQLSNSVSVQSGVDVGPIEKMLTLSYRVTFEQSWTTIESQAYTYFLRPTNESEAMHGCIVSNPVTTRYTGEYLTGCAENPHREPFSATVYAEEQKSGGLTWVEGAIGLAASTQYPVPCLIGECEHK
ncbi:hypothetical protein B0J12DRAFT_568050 [Macrophomina phaseolina]|uniref:Uncharacterized protein n=1 Tax=Macrophomina phaseolina TaxID=35725 RepID=A0ABQ8GIR7_9PEZI|nr:hypothetical protein B0J12DRAFT_568050 [Macrophomina phaseolina]